MESFFHLYIRLGYTPVNIDMQIIMACISVGIAFDNDGYQELNGVMELGAMDVEDADYSFHRIAQELKEKLSPYKDYIEKSEVYLVTHKTSLKFQND